MKISLKSIKRLHELYKTGYNPDEFEVEEIIAKIGSQLGAVESIEDRRTWYDNAAVVRVVECNRHPNADKLSICHIDDGGVIPNVERRDDGLVQVVCGAPNVHSDMWAVWLPPQSIVPSSRKDEAFTLEAREIRGEMSNGMLASPSELDMTDDHDGILDLDQNSLTKVLEAGMLLSEYYDVADVIIDLENKMFTHRPDCFGELGVARELSGISAKAFASPDWYVSPKHLEYKDLLPVEVKNEAQDRVSRFMIQTLADVAVNQSDIQTKMHLRRVGIKPINQIVDATNLVMNMSAQPLHAYDYDKVVSLSNGNTPVIMTRMAMPGEKLKLLNGKEIELNEEDVVIATDKQAIALAGIMGGSETEVDENTTQIILECGTFDMYTIRRSSMRHGLFTDAVTRFNKGQSPLQNQSVLTFISSWLVENCGATLASQLYDDATFDTTQDNLNRVTTTVSFINSRLGTSLTFDDIKQVLENVECDVVLLENQNNDDAFEVTVPFWRMDISIPEDIVEEVGRMHGYANVPEVLPLRSSKPAPRNEHRTNKQLIRQVLASQGANEVLTYSFVHGNLLQKIGLQPEEQAYHIRNAISPDLQYYRPSVLPSLLVKVQQNIRAQEGLDDNKFALFELGKAHVKGHDDDTESSLPAEFHRLALVVAADKKAAKQQKNEAFYIAKQYLTSCIGDQASFLPLDTNEHPITAPFQIGRSAIIEVDGKPVGVVGEFREDVRRALKLPDFSAGFEIDIDRVSLQLKENTYSPISQYPTVRQDVTFEVPADVSWAQLDSLIHAEMQVIHAEEHESYILRPSDIYQPEGSDARRITFHVELVSHKKTLTTTEFNDTLQHIEKVVHESLNAIRI